MEGPTLLRFPFAENLETTRQGVSGAVQNELQFSASVVRPVIGVFFLENKGVVHLHVFHDRRTVPVGQ